MIDDRYLWTGDVLKQLLLMEPEWQLEALCGHVLVFFAAGRGNTVKGVGPTAVCFYQ